MLRAGLLGLPSSGKTTLFQLLTSAREAPRTHGKAEANVGISRVPDERLDRLTALFQPKKRVPATVEFADMAAAPRGRRPRRCSTSSRIATPTRCCTSCARFAIRRCRTRTAASIRRATRGSSRTN